MRSSCVRRLIHSARSGAKPPATSCSTCAALASSPERRAREPRRACCGRRRDPAARSASSAALGCGAALRRAPRARAASSPTRASSATRCSTSAASASSSAASRRGRGAASVASRAPGVGRSPLRDHSVDGRTAGCTTRTPSRTRRRAPQARAAASSTCSITSRRNAVRPDSLRRRRSPAIMAKHDTPNARGFRPG